MTADVGSIAHTLACVRVRNAEWAIERLASCLLTCARGGDDLTSLLTYVQQIDIACQELDMARQALNALTADSSHA